METFPRPKLNITLLVASINRATQRIMEMINIAIFSKTYWEEGVEKLTEMLAELNRLTKLINSNAQWYIRSTTTSIINTELSGFLRSSAQMGKNPPHKIYSKYWTIEDFNTLYTNILALDCIQENNRLMADLDKSMERIRNFYFPTQREARAPKRKKMDLFI